MASGGSSSHPGGPLNRLFLMSRASDPSLEAPIDPARRLVDPATSRVKRCLFGRGNTDENIKFAKREMEKSLLESKKRWNFDFEAEAPLDGRFEWKANPYPRPIVLRKSSIASADNVENLQPITSSRTTTTTTHSSSTTSSSSDEQSCDQQAQQQSSSSTSESSQPDPGPSSGSSSTSSSQRASNSVKLINQVYRQRRRSKSKVKTQDRKAEGEEVKVAQSQESD